MSARRTFPEQINDWLSMTTNLRPHLTELPGFEVLFDEMVALIAEAQALQSQCDLRTANLRDTNKKRTVIAVRGQALRSRMAARLQSEFGFQNDRLREFGVKPRRPRRPRQSDTEPEVPTPEPEKPAPETPVAEKSASETPEAPEPEKPAPDPQ